MSYFSQIRKAGDNAALVKELADRLNRSEAERGLDDGNAELEQIRTNTDKLAYTDTDDNHLDGYKSDTDSLALTDLDWTRPPIAKGGFTPEDKNANLQFWTRPESRAQSWADMSGNGLTVAVGSSVILDGLGGYFPADSNSVVTVTDNAVIRKKANFSVFAWIYPLTIALDGGVNRRIVVKPDDANNGYVLTLDSAGRVFARVLDAGVETNIRSANSSVSANNLYHAGFTWASGTLIVYLNAVSSTTTTTTAGLPAGTDLIIGRSTSSLGRFQGYIWDVRYYDKTLSGAEVTNLYKGGSIYGLLGQTNFSDTA